MRKSALKKWISVLLAGLLALCCIPAAGCAEKEASVSTFALDTYITMSATGREPEEALTACKAEITRLENLLSATVEASDVYRINAAGGETVEVSSETAALLNTAFALTDETGGAFDVTVRPLVTLWNFEGDPAVPSEEAISEALTHVGREHIRLDGTAVTADAGSGVDLGGIAKGYVTDCLKTVLDDYGIKSAMVVLGGNVYAHGLKADGSKWRVGVMNPQDNATVIGTARVQDCCVITSGGYQRYFEEDGKTYHHILDPETGYPAESGFTSVTIFASSGTLADAFSTALFVMGPEEAEALWRTRTDFEYLGVLSDGSMVVTDGVDFTAASEDAAVTVITR